MDGPYPTMLYSISWAFAYFRHEGQAKRVCFTQNYELFTHISLYTFYSYLASYVYYSSA